MLTRESVLDALKVVIDPDFNQDIVSLGFVKNIVISDDEVSFDIELTTAACPIKKEFQQQAENLIQNLEGVTNVIVNMTARPAPKRAPSPAASMLEKSPLAHVRSMIAISSCKGGVGKSTLSAHFAQDLAQRGFRVGLLDIDIHGPSVPTLFGITSEQIKVNDKKQLLPIEKNGLKIMSFGFLLGDKPAVMRGPIVSNYVQQLLFQTDWGTLDYLFIDMPPGTGDVQLTVTQSIPLSGAVIITTPQTLSLIDVAKGMLMFEKVNVPILGIVENMSYFTCDECDKKHHIFGERGARSLQASFGVDILAELPLLDGLSSSLTHYVQNEFIVNAVDRMIRCLGKSSLSQNTVPDISFDTEKITLTWVDKTSVIKNFDLRKSCQCALCINEMTGQKILEENKIRTDIAPQVVTPLGNYAINVEWNDKHTSGIYSYKLIESIVA